MLEECLLLTHAYDELAADAYDLVHDYSFSTRSFEGNARMALASGYAMLYNHSVNPNVSYHAEADSNILKFSTTRDIEPNEELFINYGTSYWDRHRRASEKRLAQFDSQLDELQKQLGIMRAVYGNQRQQKIVKTQLRIGRLRRERREALQAYQDSLRENAWLKFRAQ
jgi:hypothetical protein